MAPKRSERVQEPPSASSSEAEDEVSSGEGDDAEAVEQPPSDSSSEDEDGDPPTPTQKNAPSKKPETAARSIRRGESESEESGSETESDSGTPSPKPIATKPMEQKQTPQTSKSILKPAPSPSKPGAKRAGETEQARKSSKRPKKEDGSAGAKENGKKQLFQRIWSEDDEITVLNGMLEYYEKGTDPMVDMAGFHEFIKKSLRVDVSKAQLAAKVRRLKKKYVNGRKKYGENPNFARSQEQNSFDLSKMIWGDNGSASAPKANGKVRKVAQKVIKQGLSYPSSVGKDELSSPSNVKKEENMEVKKDTGPRKLTFFSNLAALSCMEEKILQCSPDVIEEAKMAELDERWMNLGIKELELYLQRHALVGEQAKLLLDHYKSLDK